MKKWQWACLLLEIIGCAGMGIHLFLFDGITHPTWVLTAFAALFTAGMVGSLVCALRNLWKNEKSRQDI